MTRKRGIYTCRSCGAEAHVWHGGEPCPHCGAPAVNRLDETRVRQELGIMEYLYGDKADRPQTGTVTIRQLELFGK